MLFLQINFFFKPLNFSFHSREKNKYKLKKLKKSEISKTGFNYFKTFDFKTRFFKKDISFAFIFAKF